MKITLLISSLSGGGAERVTCNLANYLYRNNHDVDVLTLTNDNDTYKLDAGVNRICLLDVREKTNKLHNLFIEQRRLRKYLRENQDVSCYVAMLPVPSFLLTKFKKYTKGKIIVSQRVDPAHYNKINGFLMEYAIKRCDGLVVQTKEISEYYKHIKDKAIIPNAINEDIVFSEHRSVEEKIVAVGRLVEQKNYPMVIKSFAKFNDRHPEYTLEVYGQGVLEKSLKELANDCRVGDKVKFMGYDKKISEKISSAACFVMASNFEGVSNALIEAMCIGIPCVVTDCDGGGAKSLIKNNENGILIEKEAVDEMFAGMCKIIEDRAFAEKISGEALKVREKLSGEKIYGRWLDYIEKVVMV